MGNEIDCKFVCQQIGNRQDNLLTTSLSIRRVTRSQNQQSRTTGYHAKPADKANPRCSFAKPVTQVLNLSRKVNELYRLHKCQNNNDQFRGVKLDPHYIFHLLAYYDGQWMGGRPHGFGTFYYDSGSLLEGTFNHGVIDCQDALFILDNGSFYKGSIKNSQANGYGIFKSKGFTYEGSWTSNRPHGFGEETQQNKDFYKGEFKQGKRHGNGKLVKKDGVIYEGVFVDGKFSHNTCVLKPTFKSPRNALKPTNLTVNKAVSKAYFPVKSHFRQLSSQAKPSPKQPKLDSSLRIQRLDSLHPNAKNIKLKVIHRRQRSEFDRIV